MRKWLHIPLLAVSLTSVAALAQNNIRPDTSPRVPPQAGQGLPLEDRQFLSRATNLSEAEVEAGKLAEKSSDPAVRDFGRAIGAEHGKLRNAVGRLAQQNEGAVQPHPSREWWTTELQRIAGLTGEEFDRSYLNWQLQTHLALVKIYQQQASNAAGTDLSKFAITTMNQLQRDFDQAKRLGAARGVAIETIKQPPQY
ncbi:DUF4142 domain-containing protein [Methylobacterium sp. 092160098-2]|jgi:predicted outer membrane protein|uniref:DUF4142 domain-containing protein n=1 Tax=Methylobacterium sp. 092160098-2 TaxID=3025129 RepID=UPI002381A4B2|nr:DUF4142 domain-containing protein [Methylobacterium sp. 092160098-2]MDE4914693.1 DUF4142 domain-containing protein [Methylobacterium sp. 092160098-2]